MLSTKMLPMPKRAKQAQPFTADDLAWGEQIVQRLHGVQGYEAWAELLAKERAALRASLLPSKRTT